ncbi:hypothetical protein [Pantoea dispersa]|uniref:Phage tail protein n=1 Tax=Pantoea dispersa TaxID=59814 RepID=A0ABY3A0C9_9GAMM|nr:hypothetical protein [Pantoea dispersa]TQC75522.1 hypothetical protein FK492_06250 [Pantoea dispersa]
MPAGTIALTNNSATVTGSGTSFTTELKVNDFVVSTVGGVAYTLGVKSIESNTSLTLMENYTGPSASGQSWTPVPYGTMAAITAQLAAQVTYAIRGLNLDKANWQQVFTAPGNITVSLPDGTSWQGPSWSSIVTQFGNKADKSALDNYLLKSDNLASVQNKVSAMSNLGYSVTRSGSSIVRKSKDVNGIDLIEMDFLIGATTAIGAFNSQTVGGITYYTHFYKFNLPQAMPNGILVALATIVGDRFGNQNPGYNADVKVSRDKDDGSGLLTSYLTISVKTPQTGWFPYFNIRVVGY